MFRVRVYENSVFPDGLCQFFRPPSYRAQWWPAELGISIMCPHPFHSVLAYWILFFFLSLVRGTAGPMIINLILESPLNIKCPDALAGESTRTHIVANGSIDHFQVQFVLLFILLISVHYRIWVWRSAEASSQTAIAKNSILPINCMFSSHDDEDDTPNYLKHAKSAVNVLDDVGSEEGKLFSPLQVSHHRKIKTIWTCCID